MFGTSWSRGIMIAMQIVGMLADGIITVSEIATAAKYIGSMYGVDMSQEGGKVDLFEETDGDLHIIIKKELLDKLQIKVAG